MCYTTRPWVRRNITTSFRLTHPTRAFLNTPNGHAQGSPVAIHATSTGTDRTCWYASSCSRATHQATSLCSQPESMKQIPPAGATHVHPGSSSTIRVAIVML